MRAMGADGKLELEQQLVRVRSIRVLGVPILPADLAEFTGPVRQHRGSASIEERRVVRTLRIVVTPGQPPPSRELVFARQVIAHAPLPPVELLAIAPDDFAAPDELVVNRARQRTPSKRRIDAKEVGRETAEIDAADDARGIVAV